MIRALKRFYTNRLMLGLVIVGAAVGIQNSPLILQKIFSTKLKVEQVGERHWRYFADTKSNGLHHVSFGRPHGLCEITTDSGKLLDRNIIEGHKIRSKLFLGGAVEVKNFAVSLNFKCQDYATVVRLTHDPIVTAYGMGNFIQILRQFTYLILGPLAAGVILLTALLGFSRKRSKLSKQIESTNLTAGFLCFGLIGLLYSLSLAHFPRLFISEELAFQSHIALRHLLSCGFVFLAMQLLRPYRGLLALHGSSLLLSIVVFSLYSTSTWVGLYKWQYFIFLISAYIIAIDGFLPSRRSFSQYLFSIVAVSWALSQTFDVINLWFKVGVYNSPALMSLLALMLIKIKSHESRMLEATWNSTQRIGQVIRQDCSLETILDQTSKILRLDSRFLRVSVYLDRYILGQFPRPQVEFLRVCEFGYEKTTNEDQIMVFEENNGARMKQVLMSQELRLQKGEDKNWYAIIPIGKHACINLSVALDRSDYEANEGFLLLKEVYPSLKELETKILSLGIKTRLSMHKVRANLGIGEWKVQVGSVFIDVADYSKSVEQFGDPYAKFIGKAYFSALAKRLSDYAFTEFTKGDEIYFVILDEIIKGDTSFQQAIKETIFRIFRFMREDGPRIAAEHGFEPPVLRVGLNKGFANLISSEDEVKTLGNSVNIAKRLQESARKGEVLLEKGLADVLRDKTMVYGKSRTLLRKENLIEAVPVTPLQETDSAA